MKAEPSSQFQIRSVFSSVAHFWTRFFRTVRSIFHACRTTGAYLLRLGEKRREATEQYPDPISSRTADDLPTATRGLLFNDIDKCTGCLDCQKICPTQAIHIETEPGADRSKLWVSIYDIDFARCIYCGLCTEVCEPTSLTHTRQFEGAAYDRKDLVAGFGRGQVTTEQRAKWAALRRMSEIDDEAPL